MLEKLGKFWLNFNRKDGRKESYTNTGLHNSFNPCYFVIVLKAHYCGVRKIKISVKKEEMICKHDEQPTWDQK